MNADTDAITVKVIDRKAQAEAWKHFNGCGPIIVTITLPRYTPQGERRSDPRPHYFCEDGEWLTVSCWTLDSGRIETYDEALVLARKERAA